MGKLVITTNKFPINTSDGVISGIGNLDITNTTGRSGLVSLRADIPCHNATTNFKIQMSFTTYSAWKQGDLLIGDYDKSNDSNDFRIFFANSYVYYDFNSNRINKSSSSYLGKVNNWEIGNFYIKNLDTNTNILSGTAQSSNITTHLSRLSIWGWSDACIIHWLKVWQDGTNLTWDIIPYRDSQGFGLYDQVSQTMIYRVSNNDQVQSTQTVTQVQNIAWLDNMINKAYMGSNLIFEKAEIEGEVFAVNSPNPENGVGYNPKLKVFTESYASTVMTGFKIQVRIIGWQVNGTTLVRQIDSNGRELYNRFFATSTSSLYFDYNSSQRINTNVTTSFNIPQEYEFAHQKTMTTNTFWIKDLTTNTILTSSTTPANAGGQNMYPWAIWTNSGEIYGFAYLKFYKAINYGSWELVHDYRAVNNNGVCQLVDQVNPSNVLTNSRMYVYEYYAQ